MTALPFETFTLRVKPLLDALYPSETVARLLPQLYEQLAPHFAAESEEDLQKWDQDKVLLITYGDSLISDGATPLETLRQFLTTYLKDTITGVHILPFFPFSSDDGFAVIDYLKVNPELGDWEDIRAIAQSFDLMVDLVINHVSSQHEWFAQFKQGQAPGCDYFITVDPETDLSNVVRPRSSPLLAAVETPTGTQHVWATFSHDQVDLNFANPDVLLETVTIILHYVKYGARYLRLDAIGYLWKQLDTTCIHLPQTHTVIRLLRELLQMLDPKLALITETNVPNRENLSYFGNRNEAHMIYNFSLPPLIWNALLQGKADHLKTWMMSMPPAPLGCAYFNFTASHDGIGLRPTEGLLAQDEYQTLLNCARDFGGAISMRRQTDGSESPYEVNISFFDAMKGTAKGEDTWQIERFLCSQTIMMSLEGVPAFYIHSLLATPNDWEKVKTTGHNRSINRHQWAMAALDQALSNPASPQSIVLKELCRRIQIRRQQGAFHPNATQYTLHPLNRALFAFWRQSMSRDQSIFCVFNLSDRPQRLDLANLNLVVTDPWCDLLSGQCITDIYDSYILQPYQCAWITNKFSED